MSFEHVIQRIEQKQHTEHVKRLAELIKSASSNEPNELAEYLINNGVCDKEVVRRIAYYFDD